MAEIAQRDPFYAVDLTQNGEIIKRRYAAEWDVTASASAGDDLVTDPLPMPMMKDMTLHFQKVSGTWVSTSADVRLQVSMDGTNWVNYGNSATAIDASIDLTAATDVVTFDFDEPADSHVARYCRFNINLNGDENADVTTRLTIIPHIA